MSNSEQPSEQTPAPSLAPETAPPLPQPPKAVSIGRLAIGANVLVQLVVVVIIVIMANRLSFRHFKRWDFSRNQKFALSSQTKNVLGHLDAPVKAIVFFPEEQTLLTDVASLLREYELASDQKFSVELTSYRNPARLQELAEQYKFGDRDNIVILDYKGKTKFLNARDMAEMEPQNPQSPMPPTVRAFKGEETITSGLIEITQAKETKLYLVSGHGEAEMNGGLLTGFKFYLDRQNLKTQPLNLNNVDAVPADATGVVIFGPKADYSEREVKLLDTFWNENKGRLFILLDPSAKTVRLNEWLTTQGITPQGDRVIKTGTVMAADENGRVGLRNGIITSPVGIFVPSGGTITKEVAGLDAQLLGPTQSLVLDRTKSQTDKIQMLPLLETDDKYWGSTTFTPGETRQVFFDPKKDHPGPLTVAVAVEKGALPDRRVKMDTARMIVIGNAGFLTDRGLAQAKPMSDFAMNALDWMINREEIAGIPAKAKAPLQLNLSDKQFNNITLLVIVIIPSIVAVIGLLVWLRRRS